jgi:Tfp pilus assembly protein PilN
VSARMMRGATAEVAVAASPRVSLLPPEIAVRTASRTAHRRLALALIGVLVITAAGVGITTALAVDSQRSLDTARLATQSLIAQQKKYSEASELQAQVAAVTDARRYGTSTEIDWSAYLAKVSATLPPGSVLLEASVSAAAPWEAGAVAAGPLRGDPAATLQLRVQSSSDADITTWVRSLENLPGYADSSLDSRAIDIDAEDAAAAPTYTANVTLNVTAGARANRFGSLELGSPPDAGTPPDIATAPDAATSPGADAAAVSETGK